VKEGRKRVYLRIIVRGKQNIKKGDKTLMNIRRFILRVLMFPLLPIWKKEKEKDKYKNGAYSFNEIKFIIFGNTP